MGVVEGTHEGEILGAEIVGERVGDFEGAVEDGEILGAEIEGDCEGLDVGA